MAALCTSLLHVGLGQEWAFEESGWPQTAPTPPLANEQPEVALEPCHARASLLLTALACSEPFIEPSRKAPFMGSLMQELGA